MRWHAFWKGFFSIFSLAFLDDHQLTGRSKKSCVDYSYKSVIKEEEKNE